jgi:hypothetical protein
MPTTPTEEHTMSKFKIAVAAAALAIAATAGTAGATISGVSMPTAHATGKSYADITPALKTEFGGGGSMTSIYGNYGGGA